MWPILLSFIVHLVNHLVTHHPFCAEGLWQDVKSFKALAIPFPLSLSRNVAGFGGPLPALCSLAVSPALLTCPFAPPCGKALGHLFLQLSPFHDYQTTAPKSSPMAALHLSRTLSFAIDYSNSVALLSTGSLVVTFSCLPIAIGKRGNSVCTPCLSSLFWLRLTTSEKLAK